LQLIFLKATFSHDKPFSKSVYFSRKRAYVDYIFSLAKYVNSKNRISEKK